MGHSWIECNTGSILCPYTRGSLLQLGLKEAGFPSLAFLCVCGGCHHCGRQLHELWNDQGWPSRVDGFLIYNLIINRF